MFLHGKTGENIRQERFHRERGDFLADGERSLSRRFSHRGGFGFGLVETPPDAESVERFGFGEGGQVFDEGEGGDGVFGVIGGAFGD